MTKNQIIERATRASILATGHKSKDVVIDILADRLSQIETQVDELSEMISSPHAPGFLRRQAD